MSEADEFERLTRHHGFRTIEELLDMLDTAGYWKSAWLMETTQRAKKAKIRSLIRQSRDETGWPTWANIVLQRPDGIEQHVYKQETLFEREDYRQVINYWISYTQQGMAMAEGYRDRMAKRVGEQLTLPWE